MNLRFTISCIPLNEFLDGLAKIGEFLTGLAAIFAIWLGRKALNDYWLIKRSNAASVALSKFRSCIDEISDIAQKKDLYQYPSFPDEISREQPEWPHPERPARLIEKKVVQLKKELHDPISQLSGKEGSDLLQLVSKLEKYWPHLSSAIYVSLKAGAGCPGGKEQLKSLQHYLDGYQKELQDLNSEAERILMSIVELIKK